MFCWSEKNAANYKSSSNGLLDLTVTCILSVPYVAFKRRRHFDLFVVVAIVVEIIHARCFEHFVNIVASLCYEIAELHSQCMFQQQRKTEHFIVCRLFPFNLRMCELLQMNEKKTYIHFFKVKNTPYSRYRWNSR